MGWTTRQDCFRRAPRIFVFTLLLASTVIPACVAQGLVTLVPSPNPATFGQPVTLTATVPGSVGTVTFFDGTTILGYATVGGLSQAVFTTSLIQAGRRTLRAFYSGTSQFSAPVVLTVNSKPGGAFQPGAHYSPIGTTNFVSVALGDFNKDGHPDVAMLTSSGLRVLLGNANGTFQAPVSIDVITGQPTAPTNVLAGDFNNDGNMDIVVGYAPGAGTSVEVVLGNGDGTFQSPTTVPTTTPSVLALGDVNNDGNTDIVVANATTNTVDVLLGAGNATFVPAGALVVQGPTAGVVVDLNKDGNADLAVTGSTNNDVTVFRGLGNGRFVAQAPVAVGTNPMSIVTADFNGDGNPDLAIANFGGNGITVFLGNGTVVLPTGSTYAFTSPAVVTTGDINGDGITDLVVTGNPPAANGTAGFLLGNANGTFQAASTFNLRTANTGIVVSDFNGDGRSDLAIGIGDTGIVDVFLQLTPTSTSVASSANPSMQGQSVTLTATVTPGSATGTVEFSVASVPIAVAALAGGKATFTTKALPAGADKIQATYSGDVQNAASTSPAFVDTVTALPSGGFGTPTTFNTAAPAGVIALGDFNNDGITDVAAFTNLSLSLLLGKGDGTFQSPIVLALDFAAISMATGDFNRDGNLDLVLTDGSVILILLGRGNGTFTPRGGPFVMGAVGVAVGDFNLDGRADLVFALGGSIQVSQGNGDGTFKTPETGPVGSLPYTAVAVADFNNDGLPDFTSTGVSALNQGDGILRRPVNIFSTGFNPVGVAVGDFNNDGNPDAAVVDASTGLVSVALGNGNGTFAASQTFAAGSAPTGLTVGDFNGDGNLDIAVANGGSNNVSVLLGNGNGTFQSAVNYVIGANTRGVAAGDFNGDGRTDLAVTYSSGVAILLGTPPLFTVTPTALTFNFGAGLPLPGSQTIQVSSGSLTLPFDFGASVFPVWLKVSASSKTTPAVINVSVDLSTLSTGTYRTSFIVNFPGVGSQIVTVTVNLGAGVTTSTTFLVFSYVLGQPNPPSQTVGVSTDSGSFTAAGSAKYLIVTVTSTGISVGIDPTGLTIGDYSAFVSVSGGGGTATIQVLLRVRAPLVVSPSDVSVSLPNSGPVTTQSISVTSGTASVTYAVGTPSNSFASVNSTGGTTPGSFNITIDPTGLKPGIYKAIINVTSTQTFPDTAPVIVTLTVLAPGPLLGIPPGDLIVTAPGSGGAARTFTFPLISSNQVATDFTITVTGPFLTVFPLSGKTPALITVVVDPSKFAPGSTTKGSFTLTSAAGNQTKNFIVNALSPSPTLGVFPPILEVQTPRGQKTSAKLLLQNPGGGNPQNFFVTVVDAQNYPFVTVVPSSGVLTDSNPVVVQVNIDTTNLPIGPFEVTLKVKFGDPTITAVPVSVVITPADPAIALDFQGVKFDARKGEGLAVTQDVSILDLGDLPYTWTADVVSGSNFLSLGTGPTTGNSAKGTPGKITLSVNQDFLNAASTAPGTYYASVRIRSPQAVNSPKLFTAVLNVLDANQADATPLPVPTGLVFTTSQGVDPAKQTVRLFTSSKSPRAFQVSAQTYTGPDKTGGVPGINWLSTSAISGAASTNIPGVVDVLVKTAGLAPGVYTGGVTFSLSSTAVRVVNVSLVVTPPASSKTTVRLAAAGCTPTALVPTFVGGLVNNFAQQVAGPVPVTVKVTDDCGNLVPDPTNPASTPADVSITFSVGDPSAKRMLLTDPKNAGYTITWVPSADATQAEVQVQARLGDLSGLATSSGAQRLAATASLLGGASKVIGQVQPGTGPVLLPNSTLNNLNPQPGAALAPGTLVQIFGSNLSATDAPQTAQSFPLPPSLNGTQVIIGGQPAPLYYVSKTQINALVPFELVPGTQYDVTVTVNGALSAPSPISLVPATPGLAADSNGNVIAQHADGTLISASSPALAGEVIILYLVGMGATSPPVTSGVASPSNPLAVVTASPVVTVDSEGATDVQFAGLSPGSVGLYQINVRIPADTLSGTHNLVVTQNGVRSNTAVLPTGTK